MKALLLIYGLITSLTHAIDLPLHISSRWILNSNNTRIKLRCVNWAGHLETNIPEGLDKQPLDKILQSIVQNRFNCIRLTYSIDHALAPNTPVSVSFTTGAINAGLDPSALEATYLKAVSLNPFLATSTTQDVFARIVDALWALDIMTVLDNHVSRAGWCCNYTDGNGWWSDAAGFTADNQQFFDTKNWLAGLEAQALWAKDHPGVVAMSLRNELRQELEINSIEDWYGHMQRAAETVHRANANVLILLGGVLVGLDLSHIGQVRMLNTNEWREKLVWEFHAYSFSTLYQSSGSDCASVQRQYGMLNGYLLAEGQEYTAPLFLSEFGFGQTGGNNAGLSDRDAMYMECLKGYMEGNDAEWAVWALQGSYYVRDRTLDYDESYGILSHDWSVLRNPDFSSLLGGMWEVTQGP